MFGAKEFMAFESSSSSKENHRTTSLGRAYENMKSYFWILIKIYIFIFILILKKINLILINEKIIMIYIFITSFKIYHPNNILKAIIFPCLLLLYENISESYNFYLGSHNKLTFRIHATICVG